MRVHPEYLAGQAIDPTRRRESGRSAREITRWERHLHANGTRDREVLPARLQGGAARALPRARRRGREELEVLGRRRREREHWNDYQQAYEEALGRRAPSDAPWYVIPADHKWLMRTAVASILVHHLEAMDPRFPEPTDEERAAIAEAVAKLRDE